MFGFKNNSMEYYLISIIIRRFKIYIEHLENYKFLIEIEITLFKYIY